MNKRHGVSIPLLLLTLATACGLTLLRGPAARVAPAAEAGRGAVESAWWDEVSSRIAAEEYLPTEDHGVLQAPNRAQGFRAWFRGDRVEIRSRISPERWQWCWQTQAVGRGDAMSRVARARPHLNGARVEYERRELTEWYENRPEGLEQGFTLTTAPSGRGPVRIVGVVGDDQDRLTRREEPDAIVCSLGEGADVVRYGDLRVVDATGRELPSRMRAAGATIELAFEDDGATYPVVVDPLVTSPSWTYSGAAANEQTGYSVATAGDVNGDGLSDVLVAAPAFANAPGVPIGKVFLFIGRPNGPGVAADWSATPTGCDGVGRFGESVASAGDVNDDGYDDVVIGAPLSGGPNQDSEGLAFVWHGGPPGAGNASGLGANGTLANADWTSEADITQANWGQSVACAGDVNGDGFADLIVGSPGYRDNGVQLDEGWAFVWLGGALGLGANGTPANADWSCQSDFGGSALGWSVSTAGDVNADGYDDVLIGAPGANAAFLWLGGAVDLGANGVPFNADWSANGTQAGARLGESVSTAGDVDGDGYADVAIGAPRYDDPEADEGMVFVWLGGPTDLGANGNPVNADWSKGADSGGAHFGARVGTAGDSDGDGFADLIVGGPRFTNDLALEGAAWVFRGGGSGLESVASWMREGNQGGAEYGGAVATAGDVNGDGFADVLVGAALRDAPAANAGWVGLYTGSARGPEASSSWTQEGNQGNAHLGQVASAGDVNGDGYSDVLVGVPDYDGGQADEGRVYLYVGQPTGLSINSVWRAEVDQAGASLGSAVSTAGDLNGDGFADVAIGAPSYDVPGGADAGGVFVWFGAAIGLGANGTAANADRTMTETQPSAHFGSCVAWLGDVNGDSYSDVAVGAPDYDNTALGQGLVQVFYGVVTGIELAHSWRHTGDQGGCNLGESVAGAGDVNGDGLSDMIVGAPGYDAPEEDEGRAGVFLGNSAGFSHVFAWFDESDQAGGQFGGSVAGAGDINGDGYSDVLVGAPWWESGVAQLDEGRVSLYLGSAPGLGAAPVWSAEAGLVDAQLGQSVASAGDVNGDGFSDVLLGAPGIAGSRGAAYLWFGGSAGLGAAGSPANADWTDDGDLGVVDGHFGASVASAGDVDGDGFSDLVVGAPNADGDLVAEGRAFVYYGNASHGQDRAAQQRRADDSAPVQALGSSNAETQMRLRALARSAGGRARVRLESEFRMGPSVWLPGALAGLTSWIDTGLPGARGSVVDLNAVVNLPAPGLYKWRSRVATKSPLFPHGPWLKLPDNALGEGDIRLQDALVAVEPPRTINGGLRVLGAQPSRGSVRLGFALAARSTVSLDVFDVGGRRVRSLARSQGFESGSHEIVWEGRSESGSEAAAGCYFALLSHGAGAATARITRVN